MDTNRNTTTLVIGVILLVLGVLSLVGTIFDFLDMDYLWPLIVAGVGVAFFVAAAVGGKDRAGLAVPGSILVTIGLILFVMNYTDTWEAWSYCWALIVAASGAGVWVSGYLSGQPELRVRGRETFRTGLVLFFVFAVIMEFIFSITGDHRLFHTRVWAALLSLLGLLLLVTRMLRIGKPGAEHVDLFWPILMIGVGLTAFLYLSNWITADNLWRTLNLWPVLLIAGGVGLLFRNRTPWIGALLGLLVVGGMLSVALAGEQLGITGQPDWISNFDSIQIGDIEIERITGSGEQITEDRPITGVSRVELAIPADLEIIQGPVEGLVVKGNGNVLPVLTTGVSGGKLTIRYKPFVEVRTSQPPQITLTVKDLEALELSASGSVEMDSLRTGDFKLALTSSGDIQIQDLQADRVTVDLSSSGDIILQGAAQELELDVASSGTFQAGDLEVQEADVTLSSSGKVTLWVVQDLQGRITSSGDIRYYGSPAVHQNLSSSGKLVPLGNK